MPYITRDRRELFEKYVREIPDLLGAGDGKPLDESLVPGDLNYVIYSIVKRYLDKNGHRYRNLNMLVGALECCKEEVYRRLGSKLEDGAIERNGDIE